MDKKKIIISIYDDINNPYYAGGGAIATKELSQKLAERYDVTVISAKYPNSQNEAINGVKHLRIGPTFIGAKLGQLVFQMLIPFYVITLKYDLWIENFTPPFSTNLVPLFTKKPVIGFVHMLSGEDMKRKYHLPFEFFENIGLKKYKSFAVVTNELKEKIQAINPKADITVIPNAVEEELYTFALINRDNYIKDTILYLGRIEMDQKGLDLLLQAYALIKEKVKFKLVIAGSGIKSDEVKLKQLISDLELNDNVTVLGRISGKERYEAFAKSIFQVCPSRFETFGLVVLEAMAFGSPTITYNIKGFEWIPENTCVKVPTFDIDKLASTMLDLSEDEEHRTKLSMMCEEKVKDFTWDKSAQQLNLLVESLI